MSVARTLGWRWPVALNLNFTPEITAGHLLQAFTILCVGTGGIVGVYLSLWTSIHDVSVDGAKNLARVEARVLVLEDRRHGDDAFQGETRQKLDRVLEVLARLRAETPGGSTVWDKNR